MGKTKMFWGSDFFCISLFPVLFTYDVLYTLPIIIKRDLIKVYYYENAYRRGCVRQPVSACPRKVYCNNV
jgi:hypothetical protein